MKLHLLTVLLSLVLLSVNAKPSKEKDFQFSDGNLGTPMEKYFEQMGFEQKERNEQIINKPSSEDESSTATIPNTDHHQLTWIPNDAYLFIGKTRYYFRENWIKLPPIGMKVTEVDSIVQMPEMNHQEVEELRRETEKKEGYVDPKEFEKIHDTIKFSFTMDTFTYYFHKYYTEILLVTAVIVIICIAVGLHHYKKKVEEKDQLHFA
ncbi:SKN-1 Dependent Zygotic transcript [Caenorhabditis elegans]|uniref:SKN-1 Dependent Zygotic transcript n=1 Tax=Caenorhabditis elegans TaxID=6239 RepID=Q93932_CAEEL|nr:SKN-1 Dependent Zygotic transcript [Caenorhabditis elegans]CAB03227.1 SKN-1 Dependent Zygotic transcript [Caenorhabditis elegans]|eukprot:NP_502099.1 SKN-1 Dependent Zygotic transcript [Caenorhabditis elegans]